MANSKISALTAATTPVAGTETLPIVQGGVTKQVSIANLTAGRAVSAASLSLTTPLTVANGGTGTGTAFTAGSIVFAGASGVFSQNNSQLFWDNSNARLGIGTTTPGTRVELYAPSGTSSDMVIRLRATDSGASYGSVVDLTVTATGSQVADFIISTRDSVNITETLRCTGTGDVKANRGNYIPVTAGKGINFTANTPAAGMTSQLLNWYEEGTWTPNQGAGLTLVGAFSSAGTYTRIGRQVFIRGSVSGATSVAVASAGAITTNLPYSAAADATGTAINAANNASSILRVSSATLTAATAIAATTTITFSAVYSV